MKILICGGDERSVLLAGMLKNDGHEVLCFCLDRAQLPDGVRAVSSPEQADAVILPVPAENAHGLLNAPLAALPHGAHTRLCRTRHRYNRRQDKRTDKGLGSRARSALL